MCADAGGIYQTLYNLFSFLNPDEILCVTCDKQFKAFPPTEPFLARYITYKFEAIETPNNRLGKYIKPFAEWFNYSFNNKVSNFKDIRQSIKDFAPDIVISCSNGPKGIFMHYKLLDGLNITSVIPYFMDDWMYKLKLRWVGGEITSMVKKLLDNQSWLMISNELSDLLKERYKAHPKRLLTVHNPVDLSNAPAATPLIKKQQYTIAYAGALWQMHFDSFKVMAESVNQLTGEISATLIVYTSINFWNWRKAELEPLGVVYGGNIAYKDIHNKLAQADALLVCSSFSEDWINHTKGSVQTKITDYLKARRPIISCGPSYSANHSFLKEHHCGICIESNDVNIVETELQSILSNIEKYKILINNGWELLEKEYTFAKVHEKLKQFLYADI